VLSINDVVGASANLLKRLLGEDVAIHLELDPTDPRVKADAGQLEQVLMNLAVNARDAMPDGGSLTIRTSTTEFDWGYDGVLSPIVPGHYAVLTVTDDGGGMSEDTQRRVFEPFFTTKELGKGTGLGLSTVYGIVKQCGGLVRVQSAVGRGASFTIYLPIASGVDTPEVARPRTDNLVGTETLLLVEDAAAVRAVMRRSLERFGYTVVEAPDGQTALTHAGRSQAIIDLLVTDLVLPVLSGRQLAARLRETRPDLPVVYMSGHTDDIVLRSGDLEKRATFLQKPFTTEALVRAVRELLEARSRT
jgi:CheY-like chemotaxis protein